MFTMATGSGKTLIMAATMLYYYKQGYRHFLFFVNRNNIVAKTENNFINVEHPKYLFTEKIVINDSTIAMTQVETFSDAPQGIEIKFTSIQKLYNDIHIEKENLTTLNDLHNKDIIMLADEAHHLNTDTKAGASELFLEEIHERTSATEVERKGWEHTVIDLILHKNNTDKRNKNVLLEFTATIPNTESVAKKYQDKIIYKFGLKDFLAKGYTKEINLISSTLDKKERVLQALLFQWYRHKIALKYNIANFKPVILFRSKTIAESQEDYKDFLQWIDDLSRNDFNFLDTIANKIYEAQQPTLFEMGKSRTKKVLEFVKNENIRIVDIINWIQDSYQERNTIITNSKNNKTKKEKTDATTETLLNNLEDVNNHIRAIFTVERLTEGWDVLNLFDIVRLYKGQNAGGGTKKTPEATIKEKQLIGRGVRYFPFSHDETVKNKRKFDSNLDHELRVLEELYYYTHDENSRYISHLKAELKKDGYITDDKIVQTFALKEKFKNSLYYETTKLWYNTQVDNPNRKKKPLDEILKNMSITYALTGFELHEEKGIGDDKDKETHINGSPSKTIPVPCKDIERHIFLKAVHIKAKQERSFFQFEQLEQELDIHSIDELQTNILADSEIHFIVEKEMSYDKVPNREKLEAVKQLLDMFSTECKKYSIPKIGSEFKAGSFSQFFSTPKTKIINENHRDDAIAEHNWYVLNSFVGTSEEKELVNFIKNSVGNLQEKYQDIYFLKNEEIYKIYDFEQGRGFQPDFLLFLKDKEQLGLYYQIFIEPKGGHLLGHDEWKENFLKRIAADYGDARILRAEHFSYKLIGLPFFSTGDNANFEQEYKKLYS